MTAHTTLLLRYFFIKCAEKTEITTLKNAKAYINKNGPKSQTELQISVNVSINYGTSDVSSELNQLSGKWTFKFRLTCKLKSTMVT